MIPPHHLLIVPLRLAALAVSTGLSVAVSPAQAGVTEAWVQRYSNTGYTSNDQAFKVVHAGSGDFFVVGATADRIAVQSLVLIKYSGEDGSAHWQRRYDGPAEVMMTTFASRNPILAAVDGNGDLVVATRAEGSSKGASDGSIDNGDFYTAKYSGANGDRLWEKRYTGPGGDEPAAMALDASGQVVVTGKSQDGLDYYWDTLPHRHDFYTAKYAAEDGAVLWERRYDGPAQGEDIARAVAVAADGNVVVTGSSKNGPDSEFQVFDQDIYTAKYAAADGALLWEERYDGPANGDDGAEAVTVDASGNVVVAGYARTLSSALDFYTVKYAGANGAVLWERFHDGTAHSIDAVTTMVLDLAGDVIVTGISEGNGTAFDYLTSKYAAADGTVLWAMAYSGPGNGSDLPQALALDAAGNVVVAGCSAGVDAGYDFCTVKYSAASGALLWEERYNGPASQDDVGKSVALDAIGNAVVTGYSLNENIANGFYTAKYAAANGALLWERPHHYGPTNLSDAAYAVEVDGSGNVVVTGYSGGFYTAKYAAANGALIWERRNSSENRGGRGPVLVVDAEENVVVSGHSLTSYAAKYRAADGALSWERAFTSIVDDLAVDPAGNVVVTGGSLGSSSTNDCYTAKYEAAAGALLWEMYYNGPANGSDAGRAVAVDSSGNVFVTGTSQQPGLETSPFDFYTAKYAAATGALLWENTYNDQADADDIPLDVVVDASGNIVVMGTILGSVDFPGIHYAAKYEAGSGALLWEVQYLVPADVTATAVTVDASGTLAVSGFSYGAHNDQLLYTAKFSAQTGTAIWENRSTNPADYYYGRAIAMDAAGTVVVSGQSFVSTANRWDFHTAAYASADGAVLWERSYNGPASGDSVKDYATIVYRPTVPPVSFAAWAASFGLVGTSAAADADPDHDGRMSGVEFVLGGDPVVDTGPVSPLPTVRASGGEMLFTFLRSDHSESSDVALSVQSGNNLLVWQTVFTIGATTASSSPGVSIVENGPTPDAITVAIPIGSDETRFARMKVKIAP